MSSFLYGLGRAAYRRRRAVLLSWLAVLAVVAGLAGLLGGSFDEKFTLPGTESQAALDSLSRTFPDASGVTAQVIMVAPEGETVRDREVRSAIDQAVDSYAAIDHVRGATSPFDKYAKGLISDDDGAAIIQIRLEEVNGEIPDATYDALEAETAALQQAVPGSVASVGGEAYSNSTPSFSIVEALGVVVALVVLLLTLGSLRAAGMPLLTALLGVSITVLLIVAATGLTVVSSTTPMLSVMLGLAVGIDYALFITSRHRDQLGDGMDAEESAAQAVATAGSAVVFAGLTVMIALVGLSVAGIPFLTTMGVAAAVGVAIAVVIALTLVPALLGFTGDRLRPRRKAAGRGPARWPRWWVRIVTKWPLVTVVVVIAALGALAYPAKDLQIALPDNGTADPGTPARVTYDLVSEHFGVGYNGPLVVSATMVGSDDPLRVIDGIADDIRALPGVASVPLATPNQTAVVGIVQVIPTTGPDTQETKDLVLRIRALQGEWRDTYDVPAYVTGFTAVGIDVSDRLGKALVPFGVLVVGLSLLLLTMVFRSVAVPIKATLGYLLSVAAAFGVTAMVFEYGWFSEIFNVEQTGPVISFLPILLMGILFGLSMDYEVFLVSRMREDYVHSMTPGADSVRGTPGADSVRGTPGADSVRGTSGADSVREGAAQAAIGNGFAASARVVVAAAVIMFAVFAAFVPEGEGPIKTISFALAVGVFIDAFVVRMTLVPAVLALLGAKAWWLPRWIDRRLPSFDVEGEGLAHQMALRDWPAPDDSHLIYAERVRLGEAEHTVRLAPGEILIVDGQASAGKSALLLTLAGRMRLVAGRAKVAGLVLPEQAGAVRARTGFVDCARTEDLRAELRSIGAAGAEVVFVDHVDVLSRHDDRAALASLLEEAILSGRGGVVLGARDRALVDDLIPGPYSYVTLGSVPDLADSHRI